MSENVRPADNLACVVRLASGDTAGEAARAAGVTERTVYRWLQDPEFKAAIQTARDQMLAAAVGKLSAYASEAVGKLRKLLSSKDDRVTLGAARSLLEHLVKVREHAEYAAEIERIKGVLKARGLWDELERRPEPAGPPGGETAPAAP